MAQKVRKLSGAIGSVVGLGISAPVFYSVYQATKRPAPVELPGLIGRWGGRDGDGDTHLLKFNAWGMAAYEGPFGNRKGPLLLHHRGAGDAQAQPVIIEVAPLLPWLPVLGGESLFLRASLMRSASDVGAASAASFSSIRLETEDATANLTRIK